jgi:hypothetical protein
MTHTIHCRFEWWKVLDFEFPKYICKPFLGSSGHNPPVETIGRLPELTIEFTVGIFFVLLAGVLGILILELLYNKADWFLTPLTNYCTKRYSHVQERNRLRTMRGHP